MVNTLGVWTLTKKYLDMKNIILWLKTLIFNYKKRKQIKKKINELKKRDPFIYKH